MPPPLNPERIETASRQASEWFVLMNSGKVTPAQQQAFKQWFAESENNQQAWQQTQGIWQGLEQLQADDIAALKDSISPRPEPTKGRTQQTTKPSTASKHARAIRFGWPSAPRLAFSALALMLTIWVAQQPFWTADYSTGPDTSGRIALSDGSVLELNADSAVAVNYSDNHREIRLLQGEAYFTVAKDAKRPFDVIADGMAIRALGTQFNVNRDGDATQVTVFEHAVRVTAEEQKIPHLPAGQSASYADGKLGAGTTATLSSVDSWRQHRLIFADRKLGEVIAILNKYRRWPILLIGADLKNRAVTGIFDTNDTDTTLDTIQQTLTVNLHRLPGGIVLMTGK